GIAEADNQVSRLNRWGWRLTAEKRKAHSGYADKDDEKEKEKDLTAPSPGEAHPALKVRHEELGDAGAAMDAVDGVGE
ncbi:MAG: hypothetical protein ACO1SX_07565, partial [Actinomycetota bacterium]